jgi:glycosyltransferase involved in cell wall biosynthesis
VSAIRLVHVTTVDLTVRFLLLGNLLHLQRAGCEVSAVCAEGPWTAQVRAAGVPVYHADLRRNLSPLADLGALVALVRLFRRLRPHLVHTHTPKANLLGRLAARAAGVPVVVATEHGFFFYGLNGPSRAFWMALARLGAALSDLVFVINQEDLATARSGAVGPAGRYELLAGGVGVDLERFKPASPELRANARAGLDLPPNVPVAGIVGRLDPSKGQADFLAAAARVRSRLPASRFLVVGPSDRHGREAYEAQAAALGLSGAVTFAGMRTDMPAIYAAMDLVCLPSRREGLPVVLLEAAAMGLPAVASDIRGCRDVVVHEETGLLTPPGDIDALAGALGRIMVDPALAASMGVAARCRAETLFDQRQVWADLNAEYRRLLNARGVPWL